MRFMDEATTWRENYGVRLQDKYRERRAFNGFSKMELADLGALPQKDDFRESTLHGIHHIFARNKWEHKVPATFGRKELYPLGLDWKGNSRKGNWSGHDELVWKELEPCLKLASKFITYAHIFPWFDSLIHGEKRQPLTGLGLTSNGENLSNENIRTFHSRPDSVRNTPEAHKAIHKFIRKISKNLVLGISKKGIHPMTGGRCSPYYGTCLASRHADDGVARIWLAYEIIEPLMRDGMRTSARLMCQFFVALTLLHELAHIISYTVGDKLQSVEGDAPQLISGEDGIPENGLSLEIAVCLRRSFDLTIFGSCPIILHENSDDAVCYMKDPLGSNVSNGKITSQYRSIPVFYLEDISREAFWKDFVLIWGAQVLQVYPITEGKTIIKFENGIFEKSLPLPVPEVEREWVEWVEKTQKTKTIEDLRLDERRAFTIGRWRIQRAAAIAKSVSDRKSIDESTMKMAEERIKNLPWNIRTQHIEEQRLILQAFQKECQDHENDAQRLTATLEHDEVYFSVGARLCVVCNDWAKLMIEWRMVALDMDLFKQFGLLIERWYAIIAGLGYELKSKTVPLPTNSKHASTQKECVQLLRQAQILFGNQRPESCNKMCLQILSRKHASDYTMAGTFAFLSMTSGHDLRIWYAMEAVRLFTMLSIVEGDQITLGTKQKLKYTKAVLEALEKDSKNLRPGYMKDNPKLSELVDLDAIGLDSINLDGAGPYPTPGTPGQKILHTQPVVTLEPEDKVLFASDEGKSQVEMLLTAQRCITEKNFSTAERLCRTLLAMSNLHRLMQARVNATLSTIPTVSNRLERAQFAHQLFAQEEQTGSGAAAKGREAVERHIEKLQEILNDSAEATSGNLPDSQSTVSKVIGIILSPLSPYKRKGVPSPSDELEANPFKKQKGNDRKAMGRLKTIKEEQEDRKGAQLDSDAETDVEN